jgi:hypothetical protein
VSDNTSKLNNATKKAGQSVGDAAYLSNIFALARSAVQEVNLNVLNDEIDAMSIALMAIENDSKSWVQYYDYTTTLGDTISKRISKFEGKDAQSYKNLIMSLDYPGGGRIFKSSATTALNNLQEWSKQDRKTAPGNYRLDD